MTLDEIIWKYQLGHCKSLLLMLNEIRAKSNYAMVCKYLGITKHWNGTIVLNNELVSECLVSQIAGNF